MADLNSFSITGRLTNDASFRTLASGKGILTANVAVNTGYGDYKKTLFVKVQQWGEGAAKIVQYLKKGTQVACTGELSRSEWNTSAGEPRVDFVLDTRSINFFGGKKQEQTESAHASFDIPPEEDYKF